MHQFYILYFLSLFLLFGCNREAHEPDLGTQPLLITAAEHGRITEIEQLLRSGQEIDVRDSCRWTPLMKASLNGHVRTVKTLLERGALVDLSDTGNYTAMMLAASNNHSEIVELLLAHGADVDQIEKTNDWTALIWAAKRGHLDAVNTLLEHGADPHLKDHAGKTAKEWATAGGFRKIIDQINVHN